MTERERILASIRGDVPDRIPWVPRLDFWYRARLYTRTMPAELAGLSLSEIVDRLGVGLYATIPDFTVKEEETDSADRCLGIFNLPALPYRVVLEGVDRRVTRSGLETVTEYHTPVGSLRTAEVLTPEMLEGGSSMSWVSEHPIKAPRDFEAAAYIFSHLRVEPRAGYQALRKTVGDRGLAVAWIAGTAGPMHHIMKELMPVEQFFYAMHDSPSGIERLASTMEPYYQRMKQLALESDAEVVFLGANYDDSITHPRFFADHILPPLRDYARLLHASGKYLMTHTDGENRRLMPLYVETGFDIADSVCPAPMTRLTLDEFLAAFAGRITVWGGIPAVYLSRDNASDSEFRRWTDDLLARYARTPRFVLGVSDMVTAEARWDRLEYVTEKLSKGI